MLKPPARNEPRLRPSGKLGLSRYEEDHMQEFAKKFYKSQAWKTTRAAVFSARKGLCEVCLKDGRYVPAEIVHHRVPLTPDNIMNPDITLNWDNLQLLCRECHARVHDEKKRRYRFDSSGRLEILS